MRCHQQADCSSNDSNGSDIESCFDTEDEKSDPDTNLTDVDTDVEGDSGANISWLLDENKDHPPEYYLNQEDEFDESEYINEDYSDNSCLLLDFIEERFFQYAFPSAVSHTSDRSNQLTGTASTHARIPNGR
jgi:hypothetical protein